MNTVPLKDVLRYVLKYWNLKFVEEEYAILVVPQDYAPEKRPVHDPGGARTLMTIITAKNRATSVTAGPDELVGILFLRGKRICRNVGKEGRKNE